MIQSLLSRQSIYAKKSPQLSRSPENQQSLSSLKRAIAIAPDEYALIFARCENPRLRQQIMTHLCDDPVIALQEVTLHPSVIHLLDTLEAAARSRCEGSRYPSALAVVGLESVVNIETLLEEINFVRDEFNKLLCLPVILWVNDKTLRRIQRIAPDFSNYGATSICFEN